MKKYTFFGLLSRGFIVTLLFFSVTDLKSQVDVLDLYQGTGYGNCMTTPDLEITKDRISCDDDTTVIIRNKRGYRSMSQTGSDWQYKFSGVDVDICTSAPNDSEGRVQIMFRINGIQSAVRKWSFLLQKTTFTFPIVRYYQGANWYPVSGVLVSGKWYRYEKEDNTTPFDSIVIISPLDNRYDEEVFFMNSFFLPTCPLPSAAGAITGFASVCQGQTNVNYSISDICNATSYVWSLPSGASITAGANTDSITVSFSTSATSGVITVYGANTCGNGTVSSNFTVTVNPYNTIDLLSAAGTDGQTVCINTAIANITYSTTGATGATVAGLPAGVTGSWAGNVVTISGIPTASGTFNYNITLTGGCGTVTKGGTINVTPANSITLSSAAGTDNQTRCINTAIANITYSTTRATGATVSGLPTGVTGSWAGNVVTISGIPTASGTFNYNITLTGGCGTVTKGGTINVTPANSITLSSAAGTDNQTRCINTAIANITYSTTRATGATVSGLPTGVTGSWAGNVVTISGTPTTTTGSPFGYTVTLTGGCGTVTKGGTINVTSTNSITLSSAAGTDGQTVCINTAIANITYSTTGATGATVSGLPTGVTGSWAGNVVTISGTPTTTTGSPFGYTVTLTGGCGTETTNGTITVNPDNTITLTSATVTKTQCVKINGAIIDITYSTTGATGATVTGLPAGVTGSWTGNTVTISGIPTATGIFNYNITLTGGCGTAISVGTITVADVVATTLPEVICLYDLSWSMNRDFYDNSTSDPFAIKLYHARNALSAFVDLLYSNEPCQSALGVARFPDSPQVGCDAGTVEISQFLDNLYDNYLTGPSGRIQSLIADGNSTPLLEGVNHAIGLFNTTNANKTIVLLTDGRQNCPYSGISSIITTTNTSLKNAGIKLFTIGFGDYGIVPDDILEQLVNGTGGRHYNIRTSESKLTPPYDPDDPSSLVTWNAGTALNAVFNNIIKVLLGLGISDDPLDIINQGEVKQFDIPITIFDEKVCFFVSWVTPQENYLNIKLLTPAGTELSLDQGGINIIHRNNHTIITLYDALLSQPGMTGIWKLKIDGTALGNPSEFYQHTVLNTSKKLDLKTWFDKEKYLTGEKIKIYAELLLEEKPLAGLNKTIIMGTSPEMNPGNWLVSRKLDAQMIEKAKQKQLEEYLKVISAQHLIENLNREAREEYLNSQTNNFLKNIDPIEVRIHALRDEYHLLPPGDVKIKGLAFNDNGKNGDQKAGDGIYTAVYVPKLEGTYSFNISFSDSSHGEKILRESHMQTFINSGSKLKFTIRNIKFIDKTTTGEKLYDITFTLKDKYGNIPMPYALADLNLSIGKGLLVGVITDNMNGTFTQRISLPSGVRLRTVILSFSSGELSGSRKIATGTVKIILPAIALILAGAIFLLAGKKKKKRTDQL